MVETLELILNYPVNLAELKALITSPDEQRLIWPDSKFPFCETEWLEKLTFNDGHRSYYCLMNGEPVGHIALRSTDDAKTKRIVFIVVAPHCRQKGIGRFILDEIEKICLQEKLAERLTLRVRSHNNTAKSLYAKCGYRSYAIEGTAIDMEKLLISS